MNYQKELEKLLEKEQRKQKTSSLLLHSCCGPCSSYVLEYLANYFEITILYYNPNIYPEDEYLKRKREQLHLIDELPVKNKVSFMEVKYDPESFFELAKGLENLKEGGERCHRCYKLRLEETARLACDNGFDYFGTTLSVSPYKNSSVLNEIGIELGEKYQVKYLYSDFKKKNGYKRSIELSKMYNLYRQDYCGCVYSKIERDRYYANKESNSGTSD